MRALRLGRGSCRPLGDCSRPPVTRGVGIRAARSLDFGHETAFWHVWGRFLAVFEAREALRLGKPQVAGFLPKGVSLAPCQNAVSWPKIGLLPACADGPARVGFCVAEKGRRRSLLRTGLRRARRARPVCRGSATGGGTAAGRGRGRDAAREDRKTRAGCGRASAAIAVVAEGAAGLAKPARVSRGLRVRGTADRGKLRGRRVRVRGVGREAVEPVRFADGDRLRARCRLWLRGPRVGGGLRGREARMRVQASGPSCVRGRRRGSATARGLRVSLGCGASGISVALAREERETVAGCGRSAGCERTAGCRRLAGCEGVAAGGARPDREAACGMRLDRSVGAPATEGREAVGAAARAAALGLRGG